METFFAYASTGVAVNIAVFIATMIFRQKILDWFQGIPSHLRTGLKSIEAGVLAQVKTYEADLVAKMIPTPAPIVKPAIPAAPATPVTSAS